MKNIIKIFTGLILVTMVSSCSEDVLDLEPLGNSTESTFFSDAGQINLALNGLYGVFASPSVEGLPQSVFMENMLTDNALYRLTDDNDGLRALSNSSQTPSSGFGGPYRNYYVAIGRANNLINNMEKSIDLIEPAVFNDIKAQALALRAFAYHNLTEYYGDVPYIDFLPKDPLEAFIPRSSKATIVQNIYNDLDEAASLIDVSASGNERITLATVYGIKARTALYNKEFAIALQAADKSLSAAASQGATLYENYEELFTINGEDANEILFKIPYEEDFRGNSFPLRYGYRFGSLFSQALPTQNLVDAYPTANGLPIDEDPSYDPKDPWSNRDPRLRASIVIPQDLWGGYIHESHRDSLETTRFVDGVATRVVNENSRSAQWPAGLSGYLWRKYTHVEQAEQNIGSGFIDFSLMRLGEIYLIKAEAEIETSGNLDAARQALNKLRERAWAGNAFPEITESSQEGLRKILRMERRIELASEGFRYFDMLRWGIAEKVRQEPLIGRVLDLPSATAASIPNIDEDGVVTYADRSEYDDWRSILVDGVVDPAGYESRLFGNWQNAQERNFTAPRDYLFPIPQSEIDLYTSEGFELSQNPGY
ncbi:RagB/SusD family nutrient uptake outer membrane protein [Maribacter ulvicola]|uniref:Starch-binding associating with outer membrane n=1 Tax=Maribacter ulvicola TaxID=228959 RepID=A0A1N6S574_9FLAO|nr:RagB/SusD family nutrient uptake outer membrane protein [Maribacter ulvicola]SIQ36229.1 Starch-binding associating with outer membrane [Maribacter ulvicola]